MLFSIKSENLKLASRSRDYMRKGTIENLKTCQPREQNMQLSFDKRCSFPAQNSAFSLCQTRLMSGKLSRLKSKHTRKNRHARFRDALGTPSLRKIVCGEPRVSEDDEIESDILPCFGRNFDSFINHLLLFHCFAQYAASILDLVHTQNHAMKYDKHRDILTTQFANNVR